MNYETTLSDKIAAVYFYVMVNGKYYIGKPFLILSLHCALCVASGLMLWWHSIFIDSYPSSTTSPLLFPFLYFELLYNIFLY